MTPINKGNTRANSVRLRSTIVEFPSPEGIPWIIRLKDQNPYAAASTCEIQKIYAKSSCTAKMLAKHNTSAIKLGNKGKLRFAKVNKKKKRLKIGICAPNPVK